MDKTNSLKEIALTSDAYLKSLISAIDNAKHTIDFEVYIYANDYFGEQFADAASRAAARNVKVRVLVDGIGTPFFHKQLQKMEQAGVAVRIFHPIPFNWQQSRRANYQSFFLFKLFYFLSKLNLRNHRKTCIIDKNIVYIGSMNIDQRHLSEELGGENWSDLVINLININTNDLQFAFDIAWDKFPIDMRIQKRFQKVNLHPVFRLNYTIHLRRILYKSLLKQISNSNNKIWVTIAYFNPDYFLLKKLINAAKRGVDVKLILPNKSDVPIMKFVAATFYTDLLNAGVSIYEYIPSMLHAKVLNIDDWYFVGSSNLNQRSIRHDLEANICLQTESGKQTVEQYLVESINNSRQISLSDIKKLPWYKKMFGRILLFGKYFL